jgi:para-aminobenzoate synthetase component 1
MIRTASLCARRPRGLAGCEVRSGGAITIDSVPEDELAETRDKAAALKAAIEGRR